MAAFARFGMVDQMVALSCISSKFASQNSALVKVTWKAVFVTQAHYQASLQKGCYNWGWGVGVVCQSCFQHFVSDMERIAL